MIFDLKCRFSWLSSWMTHWYFLRNSPFFSNFKSKRTNNGGIICSCMYAKLKIMVVKSWFFFLEFNWTTLTPSWQKMGHNYQLQNRVQLTGLYHKILQTGLNRCWNLTSWTDSHDMWFLIRINISDYVQAFRKKNHPVACLIHKAGSKNFNFKGSTMIEYIEFWIIKSFKG